MRVPFGYTRNIFCWVNLSTIRVSITHISFAYKEHIQQYVCSKANWIEMLNICFNFKRMKKPFDMPSKKHGVLRRQSVKPLSRTLIFISYFFNLVTINGLNQEPMQQVKLYYIFITKTYRKFNIILIPDNFFSVRFSSLFELRLT